MTAPHDRHAYRFIDRLLRTVLHLLPPSQLTQKAALSWGYRYRPPSRVIRLRSGLRFNYEAVDFIPLVLYYTGVFEPTVLRYLNAILKPGGTVIDIGANIGFHTLEFWKAVGKRGRVISIEASPEHAAATCRNLQANDLPVDDVINLAVGDHDGEVRLGLPSGGNQGMFGVNAGDESAFTVALRRIDDLLAPRQLSGIDLIKIDIEGSELGALRGAEATLSRHRPSILIELNDSALARCGASSSEVVSLLSDAGYQGWVVGHGVARPIIGGSPHECDECLFLPADAAELRRRLKL